MDIKTQAGSPWLNSFGYQFRIRNGSPSSVLQASIFGVNNSDISAKCHTFCHPKLSVSGSVSGNLRQFTLCTLITWSQQSLIPEAHHVSGGHGSSS